MFLSAVNWLVEREALLAIGPKAPQDLDLRLDRGLLRLAYLIIGHDEWRGAELDLYAAIDADADEAEEVAHLNRLVAEGRIPISPKNVRRVVMEAEVAFDELVSRESSAADLGSGIAGSGIAGSGGLAGGSMTPLAGCSSSAAAGGFRGPSCRASSHRARKRLP